MNGHDRDCCCPQCLDALSDMLDAIETMAMTAQIQASWYGWDLREEPDFCGQDQSLPVVSWFGWRLAFADDADRRSLILDKCAIVIEAQALLRS